jgi:hypothetical protein
LVRSAIWLTLGVVAIGATTTAAATGSDAGSALTLSLIGTGAAEHVVDAGPQGPSPGDLTLTSAGLVDAADDKRPRGTATGECRAGTDAPRTELCSLVLVLEEGQIVAQGAVADVGGRRTLAVVGGTERYRRARGHLSLRPLGDGVDAIDVALR